MDDWDAMSVSDELISGGDPVSLEAQTDDTIIFLAAARPTTPLANTALYRPGALVALLFLVPPVASALVLAALVWGMGRAPFWLPLPLLLWVPVMLVGWVTLRGVRLTRDEISFGRPLRPWQVIPLDAIERLESHGQRLTLVLDTGRRVSFIPALLGRGAQLRRRLLLSLPADALTVAAREEAQRLLDWSAFPTSDGAVDALTVSPPRWMPWLAAALACALAAGAVFAWMSSLSWLALAPGILALLALAACFWLAQEVFISDRGLIARFLLLHATGSLAWNEVVSLRRAPGEVALILRGSRALICAGPGLLRNYDARRMREFVSRYLQDHVVTGSWRAPLGAWRDRRM